jgi:hypothetical protein
MDGPQAWKFLLGLSARHRKNNVATKYYKGTQDLGEISEKLPKLSQINGDKLNSTGREASSHFRNKKRKYLKHKIIELAADSKNKNIRDLYRGTN